MQERSVLLIGLKLFDLFLSVLIHGLLFEDIKCSVGVKISSSLLQHTTYTYCPFRVQSSRLSDCIFTCHRNLIIAGFN